MKLLMLIIFHRLQDYNKQINMQRESGTKLS